MGGNRNQPDYLNEEEYLAASPALPSGAATSAKQDTEIGLLTDIKTNTSGGGSTVTANQGAAGATPWLVTASIDTTGLATSTLQGTGNTSLGNIDTVQGTKADAKSTATDTTPVSIVSVLKQISASVQAPPSQAVTGTFWQAKQPASLADGDDVAQGALADAAVAAGATGSVSAKLRRLTTDLDALKTANHADLTAATPAGTNTIGVAITSPQIGTVFGATTTHNTGTAIANVGASQTDSSLVAASGSTVIYVLGIQMVTGGTATNVTFNSKPAGAGTAISQLFANAANGGAVLTPSGIPYYKTNAGEGLSVTTGTGSTTGISVQYAQY